MSWPGAVFFIISFCIQPGDAVFFNILPEIYAHGLNKNAVKVFLDGRELPLLKDGSVLIAMGLFEEKSGVKLSLTDGVKEAEVEINACRKEYPVQRLTLPEKMVKLSDEVLRRVKREKEMLDAIWPTCSKPVRWEFPFQWPLPGYEASDNFGLRRLINGEPRSPHTGVDISAPEGTPVLAMTGGKVAFAGELFFSGKSVILDHGGCLFSMYFHLSQMKVRTGDDVKKGEVIGLVGMTGRATGPHLHFGVRYMGKRIHPLSLFRRVLVNF